MCVQISLDTLSCKDTTLRASFQLTHPFKVFIFRHTHLGMVGGAEGGAKTSIYWTLHPNKLLILSKTLVLQEERLRPGMGWGWGRRFVACSRPGLEPGSGAGPACRSTSFHAERRPCSLPKDSSCLVLRELPRGRPEHPHVPKL